MNRFLLAAVAALLVLPALPANAQIGIAVRAGTLGPGVEAAYQISPKLGIRATGSYLTYSHTELLDEEEVTISFDADATVGAVGAIFDFHPFGNFLRLSAGATVNLFEVSGNGIPTEEYCFGDEAGGVCDGKVFTPQRMGSMGATISHPSGIAPYVGLGFGRVAGTSRVGFLFDVGGLYTGAPEVDLVATGLLEPTASAEQEANLNEGFESFQWYPVVALGLALRF